MHYNILDVICSVEEAKHYSRTMVGDCYVPDYRTRRPKHCAGRSCHRCINAADCQLMTPLAKFDFVAVRMAASLVPGTVYMSKYHHFMHTHARQRSPCLCLSLVLALCVRTSGGLLCLQMFAGACCAHTCASVKQRLC